MLCDICQAEAATVHLTQVVNGQVKKMHLCAGCAEASGVDLDNPASMADLLLGFGAESEKARAGEPDRACPRCHLRRSDFKKTGRLGCPACYDAFAADLEPMLRAMHRRDQHAGKAPAGRKPAPPSVEKEADLEQLERDLAEAVAAERYEQAARLRDRIRQRRAARDAGAKTP